MRFKSTLAVPNIRKSKSSYPNTFSDLKAGLINSPSSVNLLSFSKATLFHALVKITTTIFENVWTGILFGIYIIFRN